jgi:NADPH-dependent glutamate synthase beta subunit-like oxidoreductase/Pyruvate/2-oxoacid:ferredoxin oxidoreductase delta subunit
LSANVGQAEVEYARGEKPSLANKTGDWRFLAPARVKGRSPCFEACFLESDIPEWLEAVKRGRWDEAWRITRRKNPFPAITGYVCFHPCMESCNRQYLDEGIEIQAVERAVGLWRLEHYRKPPAPRPQRGHVAVAGSGPAGMSCAYYLNREGFRVTVIERAAAAGGLLALGIPDYRLPRAILSRELQILADEGIEFVTGCALGLDVGLEQLLEENDAVFLATGAAQARTPVLPGAELPGVWSALEFLSRVNRGQRVDLAGPVVVVGGGNAAVDAARMALRQEGVRRVSVAYRRSREEMPASRDEVKAAEAEGVRFLFNVVPRAVQGECGKPEAVLLDRTATAAGKVNVLSGAPLEIPCGSLIFAVGQEPDFSVFGRLERHYPVFAGGDLVSGPATVTEAIRAGRIAAAAITARLNGSAGIDSAAPAAAPRLVTFADLHLASLPAKQLNRRQGEPVEEAGRCLGCGTCNSCGACALFCPDVAVLWDDEQYSFNLDYCKGCGICARECPARVLVMEGGAVYAG